MGERVVTAEDMMTRDVIGVLPTDSVRAAIHRLLESKVSGMPVVNEAGRLVGILTEEDLIALLYEAGPDEAVLDQPLKQARVLGESLYTARPVYIAPETPRNEIARRLIMRRIKRMPVIDANGVVIGVVSRRDVLRSWHTGWSS